MPRNTSPVRDSRDSRRRQQAERPQPAPVTPQPSAIGPYKDELEEAQRQNEDGHVSDK